MTEPAHLFAEPRPVRALGDLFANVWQIAYVTRDLDHGLEELRDRSASSTASRCQPPARRSSAATSPPSGRRASRWVPAAG